MAILHVKPPLDAVVRTLPVGALIRPACNGRIVSVLPFGAFYFKSSLGDRCHSADRFYTRLSRVGSSGSDQMFCFQKIVLETLLQNWFCIDFATILLFWGHDSEVLAFHELLYTKSDEKSRNIFNFCFLKKKDKSNSSPFDFRRENDIPTILA